MRGSIVASATRRALRGGVLGLFALAACAEDEILTRAREQSGGSAAAVDAAGGGGSAHGAGVPEEPTPAPPGSPQPGVAAAPAPAAPEAPPPGSAGEPGPGQPGQPADPGPAGTPAPGVPEAPKPGIPEQPKPGLPGTAPPISGPTVVIHGTVRYPQWRRGAVRVDAFDGDHSKHGSQPGIVATMQISMPGDFALTVPADAGKLYLEAAIDEDADGKPGPQDPQGRADRYPVTVGDEDIDGIAVEMKKQAPPPGGKGKKDDF